MALQVKVRLVSLALSLIMVSMLVKVAMLVLVKFERITALGGLPSGYVHCQLNLPSPSTVQERLKLSALSLTGEGTGRRVGGTVGTIAGRRYQVNYFEVILILL